MSVPPLSREQQYKLLAVAYRVKQMREREALTTRRSQRAAVAAVKLGGHVRDGQVTLDVDRSWEIIGQLRGPNTETPAIEDL